MWDDGNDGSGSGLDADLLDGQHASAFQPADNALTWVDSATGNYGTIKVDDDRGVSWAGYAIRDDWVFMSNGTEDAGVYNDTDNEWAIKFHRNAEVELFHNGSTSLKTVGSNGIRVGSTSSSDIYMQDTDHGERRIHCNSNRIGFLNSSNSWGAYCDDAGNWFSAYSVRAPSFYVDSAIYHNGDTNTYTQFHAADQWRVVTGGSERLEVNNTHVYASRQIRSNSNITAYYSDMRLKTKTGPIDDALGKVGSLEGFYYVENEVARKHGYDNDKQQVALSAQDVQAVMPEAIHPAPFDVEVAEDGTEYSKSGENYLTVDYARLVPLLVEAIKEQQTKHCLLYTSPSPRDGLLSRMPSSA